MNIGLWVVQGLLALAFLITGANKLMRPKDQLKTMMPWVEDFSQNTIRGIGVVEITGAIGLILPGITGILPFLVPLAAVGLVLTMAGAMLTHIRRSEYPMLGANLFLLALAAFVAYGRFAVTPL